MTKFLITIIRGIRLFLTYMKSNILSIFALTAVFLILHTAFALGNGVSLFAGEAARFDQIRVYPSILDAAGLSNLENSLKELEQAQDLKYYSSGDTRRFLTEAEQTVDGLDKLPDEMFPAFFDVTVLPEYRTVEELEKAASAIEDIAGVDKVSYGKEWAMKLSRGKNAITSLLTLVALLFGIVGTVLIYQTVSISMYRYHKEVIVYNIVGGTKLFITMPFVVVAACISLLCASVSFAGYVIFRSMLLRQIEDVLGLSFSLSQNYALVFLTIALLVSCISGLFSAATFLRNTQTSDES